MNLEKIIETILEFSIIQKEFENIKDYNSKLLYWISKNFKGLTQIINFKNATISEWDRPLSELSISKDLLMHKLIKLKIPRGEIDSNKYKSVLELLKNPYSSNYISILPKDNNELKLLFEYLIPVIKKGQFKDIEYDIMRDQYAIKKSKTKNYILFLNSRLEDIANKIGKNFSTNEYITENRELELDSHLKVFRMGYTNEIEGEEVNYDKLFSLLYVSNTDHLAYKNISKIIIYYLRGVAHAKFYTYLLKEQESIKSKNPVIENSEITINGVQSKQHITHKQQILLVYYLSRISVIQFQELDVNGQNKNMNTVLSYLLNRDASNTRKYNYEKFEDFKINCAPESLRSDLYFILQIATNIKNEEMILEIKKDLKKLTD